MQCTRTSLKNKKTPVFTLQTRSRPFVVNLKMLSEIFMFVLNFLDLWPSSISLHVQFKSKVKCQTCRVVVFSYLTMNSINFYRTRSFSHSYLFTLLFFLFQAMKSGIVHEKSSFLSASLVSRYSSAPHLKTTFLNFYFLHNNVPILGTLW